MASAINHSHNFDTRDMRTLVTFMRRRFMPKSFVAAHFFTESEREEFDRICAELDVPSEPVVIQRLQESQEASYA